MRSHEYIGSSPWAEDCAQVGSEGYHKRALAECRAFIRQIRRVLGPEPENCQLLIQDNPHDFGTYLSVDLAIDGEDGMQYFLDAEGHEGLEEWDDEARDELGLSPA